MAAEVSSLFRILNEYNEEQQQQQQMKNESNTGNSTVLITRDLLGSKELDLDLKVPNGWEKRLDLESGKVYLQRCNSPPISSSSTSSDHNQKYQKQKNRTVPEIQDLNLPPSSIITTSENLLEEECLDLKLVTAYDYQSVCTLDKVKSALDRAEKESIKKRSRKFDESSVSSSPTSIQKDEEEQKKMKKNSSSSSSSNMLFAAGCPRCLLYVLISKRNPKCPRCDSIVPSPVLKKPRIDLNTSL